MELRHLRYFVAVAEELNFTKAALRMCTVQPSLSQQIKDLEHEVGVQLLVRSNRKVELTEEGAAFLKEARLSLEHAEKAIYDARQIANIQKDQLKIGFVPVAEMKVFPYIMPNIRAHFPQIKIDFHTVTDKTLPFFRWCKDMTSHYRQINHGLSMVFTFDLISI